MCTKLKERYQKAPFISSNHFGKAKIIIDIDGNSYSGRFPNLLRQGAVVLKVADYEDLGTMLARPWIDYVPVKMDLSDLEEKIEWVRDNDVEARRIAESGRERMKGLFTLESIKCYTAHLLTAYSKLLV